MSNSFNFFTLIVLFGEGIASFVSPCILPMLPVYLIYLTGEDEQGNFKRRVLNSLAFVLGFTIIYILLGASASALGQLFIRNRMIIQRISGIILILFGIYYLFLIRLPFFNREKRINFKLKKASFLFSMLFGAAFSLGWSPCTGPFLGSAIFMASNSETLWQGVVMLFVFSMGLGLPFMAVSLFYEKLKGLLGWFKKHHILIQRISGIILILTGLAFLFDFFTYYKILFI